MGLPNVITVSLASFIGIGLSFSWHYSEFGKTLDLGFSLPFIFIGIFCRKNNTNNWV